MLYVRLRSGTSVGLRFIDEHEVLLPDQLSAEIDHHVPRRLDVDRSVNHRHQALAQWNEVRRDVRILITEWTRVNTWHPDARNFVEPDDLIAADQRQIEIARPRPVTVERRAIFPALPGNRASAQDDPGPWWNRLPDD